MKIPVYKVVVTIGYQKAGVSGNRGQLIRAFIRDALDQGDWYEIDRGQGDGVYLHAPKKNMMWWSGELWLGEHDKVKISTKVGIVGQGTDEDLTMDMIFIIEPSAPLVSVTWPGIGYKGYPLLKGRVQEVARSSKADERRITQIEPLMEQGFEDIRYAER